jgi:NAD(P)H-hydrate repair Nnr-like enzyme with NAD(P)H-hydrate epimerase domain
MDRAGGDVAQLMDRAGGDVAQLINKLFINL